MGTKYPVNIKYSDYNILENYNYYTEAVFRNGREKVKPIEDQFQILKDEVARFKQEEIVKDPRGDYVNTIKLWKSTNFKALEDTIKDVFGFRYVIIDIADDNYLNDHTNIDTTQFNAYTTVLNRYPAESVITEDGFYDKSHSIGLQVIMSTYYLDEYTPAELTALLLHEIGHNIDPALIDITFLQTNLICDYILKRKPSESEESATNKYTKDANPLAWAFTGLYNFFQKTFNLKGSNDGTNIPDYRLPPIQNFFRSIFMKKKDYNEWATKQYLEMLQKELNRTADEFNYVEYKEAFADNFARMYGYGPELAVGFHKVEKLVFKNGMSRIKKDKERKECIFELIIQALNDEHKTDIHRFQALINEYDKDINDPKVPKEVKAQLLEDKEKLVAMVRLYTTDFNEFYNRCNSMVANFVRPNNTKDTNMNEGFFDIFTKKTPREINPNPIVSTGPAPKPVNFDPSDTSITQSPYLFSYQPLSIKMIRDETPIFFRAASTLHQEWYDEEDDYHLWKHVENLGQEVSNLAKASTNDMVRTALTNLNDNTFEENIEIYKNVLTGSYELLKSYSIFLNNSNCNAYTNKLDEIFHQPFNLELAEKMEADVDKALQESINPKYPLQLKFCTATEIPSTDEDRFDVEDVRKYLGTYYDYYRDRPCKILAFTEDSPYYIIEIKSLEVCNIKGVKYYTVALPKMPRWTSLL